MNVVPLNLVNPNNVLNSLCRVKKILFQKNKIREGRIQNIKGKNKIPKNDLIQLIDKLIIFVDGSKIENKFIITFKILNFLNFYLKKMLFLFYC